VPLELAEVAAGLPMAASFAMAGGIAAFREGRRRSSLNEAMHELRRPLQILSLALPDESSARDSLRSSLHLAEAAVARLDREINGDSDRSEPAWLSSRSLAARAVARWRPQARLLGRTVSLHWRGDEGDLWGDEAELSQALDNLISNALEHGAGEVSVVGEVVAERLRMVVRDRGGRVHRSRGPRSGPLALRARFGSRARRGHGLNVVERAARRHDGGFSLRRSAAGTEARIELPLPGVPR
jgi:signal transduction histidine kinase